jgi:hypothetical protein
MPQEMQRAMARQAEAGAIDALGHQRGSRMSGLDASLKH